MKSETLIYGAELLVMLDEIGQEISFKQLEEKCTIKGEELRELLKYLVTKGYINWKMPLFIGTAGKVDFIDTDKIKLAHNGMEIVLRKRDYFDGSDKISQTIHNQSIITGNQNQVAQASENSTISQIIDNSQTNVLKQLIENDEELDEPKKKKLFDILEKFNNLKEGGENAIELIKKVGGIALKYVPLFFSLIH